MELGFIQDIALKQRIEDAITYIFLLYQDETKNANTNTLYQTETYRVIILYTVSIIEAVLFYLYEKRGEAITKLEYKEKQYLPSTYKHEKVDGKVLLAVEKSVDKKEPEIALRELIDFLVLVKVLKADTATRLSELVKTRNSVHLRSVASSACSVKEVDEALEMLVYVITHAPKHVR